MSVREIYFIRHGETKMNAQHRCQGLIDVPLNDVGREQMQRAAAFFKNVELDAVFASPLSRAVQSAEAISGVKKIAVRKLEWISELNHGKVEGMNESEINESFPGLMERWKRQPQTVTFPDGESLDMVAGRVRKGLLELIDSDENGTVALVTHQVISGVARCLLLGLDLSMTWENRLVNGTHFHFFVTRERVDRLRAQDE